MSSQEVRVGDQLVLKPSAGLVQILRHGRLLVDNCTAGLVYATANGRRRRLELAGHAASYGLARDSVSLSVAEAGLELTWQLFLGDEMRLRLEVTNAGSSAIHISELTVLDVDARRGGSLSFPSPPSKWRLYHNGWQSWSPTFVRSVADGLWVDPNTDDYRTKHQPHAVTQARKVISSEWFTVIDSLPGEGPRTGSPPLLLGFTTAADQLAEVRLEAAHSFQRLRAMCHADEAILPPGGKLCSETLLLAAEASPLALLDLYGARLAEAMQARVPSEVPTGWCTWYYFFGEETADDVLSNVAWLDKQRLPLDVVLIDDGYQAAIGDWLDIDQTKYPQGMKAVAEQILASGRRPGIWTAPFAASAFSKLYADHPDWVLRDRDGQPLIAWQHWGKDVYGLDLSLAAVQAWLHDLFHTLCDDWGFQFFKVDFVFAAALSAARSDPQMTRAQAVRRGLEVIRGAIGDRFLLGCGAPLATSVGLVDAMRIGPDVHVDWRPLWQDLSAPSVANAVLNSVARSFMHGKLWLNDPDCLVLRPRGDDSNLVLNETRLLATAVGLSGGLVMDGDNLPTLRRGRAEYLRRVLPPYGQSAIPLDLFQRERPTLFVLPVERRWGSWVVAALLNWEDHSCTTKVRLSDLGLPAGTYHVYNYWRQRYLGTTHNEVVIEKHQPHEAVVLLLKRVSDQPQLLSSTFHLTQGAVEVREVKALPGSLFVHVEKPGRQFGHLVFSVPGEQAAVQVSVNGRPQKPRQVAAGIWQTGFVLTDRAIVELEVR